jgi:hypothetical protein
MLRKIKLQIFYLYSLFRVRYNTLLINQIKYIEISFGTRKNILLFNIQILEITTFASRCSTNLVWAPLDNYTSEPSKFILSQSFDHFKGKEWIVWEKRAREEMLRQETQKRMQILGQGRKWIWTEFHYSNLRNLPMKLCKGRLCVLNYF